MPLISLNTVLFLQAEELCVDSQPLLFGPFVLLLVDRSIAIVNVDEVFPYTFFFFFLFILRGRKEVSVFRGLPSFQEVCFMSLDDCN